MLKQKNELNFRNNDEYLKREAVRVIAERRTSGMEGLVGGLAAIIINTERDKHKAAVQEILNYTGYYYIRTLEDDKQIMSIIELAGSADILLCSRKRPDNPFRRFNLNPKSQYLPDTRLETFVFNLTFALCLKK